MGAKETKGRRRIAMVFMRVGSEPGAKAIPSANKKRQVSTCRFLRNEMFYLPETSSDMFLPFVNTAWMMTAALASSMEYSTISFREIYSRTPFSAQAPAE